MKGPNYSEGARLFELELEKRGTKVAHAGAALFPSSPSYIYLLLNGDRRAGLAAAAAIANTYGVPMEAWTLKPKVIES
jgi:hypothetical protein